MFKKGFVLSIRHTLWRAGRYMYMKARGEGFSYEINLNGEADVQATLIAKTAELPNLVVFDVGANVGSWSLSFLRKLPSDRRLSSKVAITAFEPVASTRGLLCENLVEAGCDDLVSVEGLALSSVSGTAQMVVLSEHGGTNSLEIGNLEEQCAIAYEDVFISTLTEYCRSRAIDRIHFLKIDAEGHDALVISGAIEMLRSGSVDVVQFEYNHRWLLAGKSLYSVFGLIRGLPYTLVRVRSGRLEGYERWHFEMDRFFEANYLLVHERALRMFDIKFGDFDARNVWVTGANGRA